MLVHACVCVCVCMRVCARVCVCEWFYGYMYVLAVMHMLLATKRHGVVN